MKPFYCTLLLLLLCLTASAQSVVLSDSDKTYYLHEFTEALELNPGQATIDSLLLHPEKYSFVPVKQKPITPKQEKVYWFRVTLTNQINTDLFLHFLSFSSRRLIVYDVAENRLLGSRTFTLSIIRPSDSYYNIRRICPLQIANGQTHTIYVYVEELAVPSIHMTVQSGLALNKEFQGEDLGAGLFAGFILMVVIYSLFLYLRLGGQENLLYILWVLIVGWLDLSYLSQMASYSPWLHNLCVDYNMVVVVCCNLVHQLFAMLFLSLRQRSTGLYRLSLLVIGFDLLSVLLFLTHTAPPIFSILVILVDLVYCLIVGVIIYRKGFKPALYFILGTTIFYFFIFIGVMMNLEIYPTNFWTYNSNYLGGFGEILFFTLGLSYKVNLLKKRQDEAIREQLRLSEENRQLVERQKQELEQKVEERTAELRASQAQLIQKEKLASLGELTAGIAHEIQNPLNFVNNFSEVSAELVEEQKEALAKGDLEEVSFIADDLRQNLQKIHHHGGRASAIVRGMLEHSRTSTGEKQPTDLNALADEYLRLAYQGLRAKNKDFNAELVTEFAPTLGMVNLVPQEIGRVLLNLYNNAFYAVGQQASVVGEPLTYVPTVWVSTHHLANAVEIRVRDNGPGIPDAIREKIFQPFFTTKPTGEGTGLGLSLSYDIIAKGHGGTLAVESSQGEGTQFVVRLPV